jgi:general secretion pathway protein C
MNKRLPLLLTVLALILLAASIAYWFLQLYRPEQRPLAPPPAVAQAEPSMDAAATLFGGQPAAVAISNYQLTGVVAAGANSAVILVADGSPPKAVRIGREIVPGVTVAEVHPRYVMLSEGGVMKRVDLAPDTGPSQNGGIPPPPRPEPVAAEPAPGIEPQTSPGAVAAPPNMQQGVPPQGDPNADPSMADPNPEQPPPQPGQVQMPPPTRNVNPGQPAPVQ